MVADSAASPTVRVSAVQLHLPASPAENRQRVCKATEDAFAAGADVVVLPELSVPGYTSDLERLRSEAEPLDGPTVSAFQSIAQRWHGLVVGGFAETENGHTYNSAVAVSEDGVLLHYRKLHLFNQEKLAYSPGNLGLPVVDTAWGTLGLCVCYDLRFVEVVRTLALAGAQLICVPTAWTEGFDPPGDTGLIEQANGALVQANLSQVFLACASQAGSTEEANMLGSSLIADPWGAAAAGPLPRTEEGIASYSVNIGDVDRARHRSKLIRPQDDRRTDVYRLSGVASVMQPSATSDDRRRVRLLELDDDLTESQTDVARELIQSRGSLLRPFQVLLHRAELARHAAWLGHTLRFESLLDDGEREFAILTVAALTGCRFERHVHEPLAVEAGITRPVLQSLPQWSSEMTGRQRTVLAVCRDLHERARLSTATFEDSLHSLGVEGTVELVTLVGYYTMLAYILNGFEVDDPGG